MIKQYLLENNIDGGGSSKRRKINHQDSADHNEVQDSNVTAVAPDRQVTDRPGYKGEGGSQMAGVDGDKSSSSNVEVNFDGNDDFGGPDDDWSVDRGVSIEN